MGFQKILSFMNLAKKSIKRTQIRLTSIMYTDSFEIESFCRFEFRKKNSAQFPPFVQELYELT